MLAPQIGDEAATDLIDVAAPRLTAPTDIVVRVTTTTICGGDVHLRHGVIPAEPNFGSGREPDVVIECAGHPATPRAAAIAELGTESLTIPGVDYLEPRDITPAVQWLASDAARHVTGTAFTVDGGFTCK